MLEAIISGLFLGLVLIFSVGPVIFTILKLRINNGFKAAFYFVLGVWISDVIWIVLANFFGELLQQVISFEKQIGIAGAIFLIGLGLFYLFLKKQQRKQDLEEGIKMNQKANLQVFVTGFLINTLNPAVIGIWLAATAKTISNTFHERLTTFVICISINIVADLLKIKLAGNLSAHLTDKNIGIINKISGLLYIGFGIALLVSVL